MVIRRTGGLAEETLTHSIIGGFYEVYTELGFGYLESVYLAALERELRGRGHDVAREYGIRISYKGDEIAWHRLDMVVEGRVVIEVKSSALLPPVTERQLFNYLRGSGIHVGLILHFGWKPFIKRVYAHDRRRNEHQQLISSNEPDEPDDQDEKQRQSQQSTSSLLLVRLLRLIRRQTCLISPRDSDGPQRAPRWVSTTDFFE